MDDAKPVADQAGEVDALRANQRVFGFLLGLHGLVHVIGFLLSWRIAAPEGFGYDDVWPRAGTWPGRAAGLAWLAVAVALVVVGIRLANERPVRRAALVVPLVGSIALGLTSLPEALAGALVSAGVLAALGWLWWRRAAAQERAARRSPP